MPVESSDLLYKDFDVQFISHPDTGDVPMLNNVKAIMRSVRNLVLTNRYDHPYNPGIFSGVLDALFENFDPILVMQLKNAVGDVIKNYEPRVDFLECLVSESEAIDRNEIILKIYVRPVNSKSPIEIPLVIERIR